MGLEHIALKTMVRALRSAFAIKRTLREPNWIPFLASAPKVILAGRKLLPHGQRIDCQPVQKSSEKMRSSGNQMAKRIREHLLLQVMGNFRQGQKGLSNYDLPKSTHGREKK